MLAHIRLLALKDTLLPCLPALFGFDITLRADPLRAFQLEWRIARH